METIKGSLLFTLPARGTVQRRGLDKGQEIKYTLDKRLKSDFNLERLWILTLLV